jgi:hypothetical protein
MGTNTVAASPASGRRASAASAAVEMLASDEAVIQELAKDALWAIHPAVVAAPGVE